MLAFSFDLPSSFLSPFTETKEAEIFQQSSRRLLETLFSVLIKDSKFDELMFPAVSETKKAQPPSIGTWNLPIKLPEPRNGEHFNLMAIHKKLYSFGIRTMVLANEG